MIERETNRLIYLKVIALSHQATNANILLHFQRILKKNTRQTNKNILIIIKHVYKISIGLLITFNVEAANEKSNIFIIIQHFYYYLAL